MAFIIGLLTAVLVLDSVFLILLVLMQLPKKEAGAGVAFGGGATDALFGAGSGNFLTKATKYASIVFFVLAIFLSVMQNHYNRRPGSRFLKELQQAGQTSTGTSATKPQTPSTGPGEVPAENPAGGFLPLNPSAQTNAATNAGISAETNAPAATAPQE